uniref:Uncharacterized protein n=1 Tax=Cryptosporidium parvum TaxID=5807 RepID=F0X5Q6_CRYPV
MKEFKSFYDLYHNFIELKDPPFEIGLYSILYRIFFHKGGERRKKKRKKIDRPSITIITITKACFILEGRKKE